MKYNAHSAKYECVFPNPLMWILIFDFLVEISLIFHGTVIDQTIEEPFDNTLWQNGMKETMKNGEKGC